MSIFYDDNHYTTGTSTFFFLFFFFTFDPYLIMLSVKQGSINYDFWVIGMTRTGIELWSPGPSPNTLLIKLMVEPWFIVENTFGNPNSNPWHSYLYLNFFCCLGKVMDPSVFLPAIGKIVKQTELCSLVSWQSWEWKCWIQITYLLVSVAG